VSAGVPTTTTTTILIVGPLPAQAAALQRKHPTLRLRVLGSDERPARVGAQARHADRVIVLASFVSHSTQAAIVAAGRRPVIVHGGIAVVSRALDAEYPTASQGFRV
jgi:hypothetical protein